MSARNCTISRVMLGDIFFAVGRVGVEIDGRRGAGARTREGVEVDVSGGSDEVGSLWEGALSFRGVRNGDLKGLWRAFVASSSRRLFACGVDIMVNLSPSGAPFR
jgi:hypothetical protein